MQAQNRTALVTGASSGIGRETAIRLADNGFQVIAAARRLERLNELANRHPNIIPRPVDLSDPEDTESFCSRISELPEPVAVLVNNAGYATRGVLEDVSLPAAKRLFEVNVFSLIRLTQACLPGMRKKRTGTIVNVSSIVGKFPFPGSGIYASSKFAVEGITDALRMELAPLGIRVVTIRPGAIGTEFGEVAEKMTGDLMARTDPAYQPLYQTVKARFERMFAEQPPSKPELIADLILEAVLSDKPHAVYSAGRLSNEFLGKRNDFDDDEFYRFMLDTFGLSDLNI